MRRRSRRACCEDRTLTIPNASDLHLVDGCYLVACLPKVYVPGALLIIERCKLRHGGFGKLTLDTPRKPRTTGDKSQNHHLHGHLRQLADCYGTLSLEEMKDVMKWDCIVWPRKRIKIGGRVVEIPISESDADTVTEAAAIEWCHQRADDLGCRLVEK